MSLFPAPFPYSISYPVISYCSSSGSPTCEYSG
nr:MAG TPA: hypothetical protein [Caudoviricetes sp.]